MSFIILELRKWFRKLSKNCGVLVLEGREFNVTDIKSGGYVVQDVYGRERPFLVPAGDRRITGLTLHSEFNGS